MTTVEAYEKRIPAQEGGRMEDKIALVTAAIFEIGQTLGKTRVNMKAVLAVLGLLSAGGAAYEYSDNPEFAAQVDSIAGEVQSGVQSFARVAVGVPMAALKYTFGDDPLLAQQHKRAASVHPRHPRVNGQVAANQQ